MMRKYFLTLDLEEWYHLEYVKKYKDKIGSSQKFVPKVFPFLKKMSDEKVYLTLFVLGDVAKENADLIKQISEMGHEIACHGAGHELVYNLTNEEFREKTNKTKKLLESIIGEPVKGYRAPCFSMENEKLKILWDLGFTYDSSFIRFKEHKLYNVMDMTDFKKVESMVYREGNKYEFETPTLDVMGKSIPISGGGYFRLFPLWLMKYFMKKHWKNEDNFVFYIHPFELSGELLKNGKAMGLKNYLRFQVGRAFLQNKLFKYITWLKKQDVKFMRFKDYINEQTN
jgi:polysaccharide deacetylase family protein (PEP-CTERM system associated)